MTRQRTATVQLRLSLDSDPVEGRLTVPRGEGREFRGWLGLVAAVERWRSAERAQATVEAREGAG